MPPLQVAARNNREPFAKIAVGNDIEAAKVMCCRLRHSPQKAQKAQNEFPDFESCRFDGSICVLVPFVAIKVQTADGLSVTWSLTDSGGKTLDLNKDLSIPILRKAREKELPES